MEDARLAVCVALALLPGTHVWWSRRALLRRLDDPAFGERLLASSRRTGVALGLCAMVALLVGIGGYWGLTFTLLTGGMLVGSYAGRRVIFGETWGFGPYAVQALGTTAALFGFPLLIVAGPLMVWNEPAGLDCQTGATALLFLLLGWAYGHSRLTVVLLGARPLEDPALGARLAAVAARSRVPMPAVLQVGSAGGTWANAMALPGHGGARVLLGRTLVAEMSSDELGAIFAHEVAHLEQQAPEARRRSRLAFALLIAAPAIPWFLGHTAQGFLASLLWLSVSITLLGRQQAGNRKHELETDQRAVEICGDLDLYCRALIKLHNLARLPRRWATEVEQSLSHPSLARRLATLRPAPAAGAPLATAAVVVHDARRPGRAATLDAQGCRITEGDDQVLLAAAYGELSELRIAASRGAPRLVAVAHRRSVDVTLGAADAARVQAHLDTLDARLSSTPRPPRPRLAFVIVFGVVVCAVAALIISENRSRDRAATKARQAAPSSPR